MRLSSLSIQLACALFLSTVWSTEAQSFRGSAGSYSDKQVVHDDNGARNSVSEVFSSMASRLLGKKRRKGRRIRGNRNWNKNNNKWDDRERPKVSREGYDEGSAQNWKKAKKLKKKFQPTSTEPTEPHIGIEAATLRPEATKPSVMIAASLPSDEVSPTIATAQENEDTKPLKTTEKPTIQDNSEIYESKSGIFDVKIPLFSEDRPLVYSVDQEQLYSDLVEAAKYKVNRIVENNIKNYYQYGYDVPMMAITMDSQPQAMSAESSIPSSVAGDVSSYETNNVEASIDEGDLMKTNGKIACASYGDRILIWNAQGEGDLLTNIKLPALENTHQYYGEPGPRPLPMGLVPEEPILLPPEEVEMPPMAAAQAIPLEEQADQATKTEETDGKKRDLLSMIYMPQQAQVESLLLHEDKLVVISSGYGQSIRNKLDYTSTLNEAFDTNIRIYDLSDISKDNEPTLIKETNVHGRFDSVRADGSKVHLVSFSNMNLYSFFDQYLSRYNSQFQEMEDDEYSNAAKELAETKLIPEFVRQLMADLTIDGTIANIARVCMFQRNLSDTDSELENATFENGIFNAFAQVTSFDMSLNKASNDESLEVSVSGALLPSGWGHVYATDKMLVIAAQGWNWIADWQGSVQTTYLLGFSLLQSGNAVPSAVGSLEGTIIGDYSVDIVGQYMRVAVTIDNNMWRFQGAPPNGVPPTENYIRVLEIPKLDDKGASESGHVLEQVGTSKSFGKEGERFVGVRFSDKVAYVVTFRQTDPFYVVSFENETSPVALGELQKTGFSNYLHFVNEENTLLLGVGQEADDEGRTIGVQIVLYDAKDPANPKDIHNFDYTLNPDVRGYSSAQFDPKAFRYVSLENEVGILILPMQVDVHGSEEGNFDGFILFDISADGIQERFSIEHVTSRDFRLGCYGFNRLPDRSFVVNGDVTTLKGHSIRKYNLDTGKPIGNGIDLRKDDDTDPYTPCMTW